MSFLIFLLTRNSFFLLLFSFSLLLHFFISPTQARTSEEQRVYIAVLESAVQSKASEMGLGQGEAALLTKMARLQGELSAKSREAEQSEMQLRAFEVEMEDIRVREEQQENVTNEQNQKIQALSERLTQFGRGEDDLLNSVKSLESEKTALLDYVEDNATRVSFVVFLNSFIFIFIFYYFSSKKFLLIDYLEAMHRVLSRKTSTYINDFCNEKSFFLQNKSILVKTG